MIVKLIRKAILVLSLICCVTQVHAQSPGYLGRKFVIGGSFYFMHAFSKPNVNGQHGILSYNVRHNVSVDYVVGRRISLGFSFHYFATRFNHSDRLSFYSLDSWSDKVEFNFDPTSTGAMKVYGIGVNPKIFFSGHLAPLGSYFKPELIVLLYYPTLGTGHLHASNTSTDAPTPEIDLKDHSPYPAMCLSLEYGKNRIFFNRLILDYGLQLGAAFSSNLLGDDYGVPQSELSKSNYYSRIPKERLPGNMFLNFKLGIGLLAF